MSIFKSKKRTALQDFCDLQHEKIEKLKFYLEKQVKKEEDLRSEYNYQKKRADRLELRVKALKGVITKMKQKV